VVRYYRVPGLFREGQPALSAWSKERDAVRPGLRPGVTKCTSASHRQALPPKARPRGTGTVPLRRSSSGGKAGSASDPTHSHEGQYRLSRTPATGLIPCNHPQLKEFASCDDDRDRI